MLVWNTAIRCIVIKPGLLNNTASEWFNHGESVSVAKSHDMPILSQDSINDDCSSLRARPNKDYLIRLQWKKPEKNEVPQHNDDGIFPYCDSIIVGKSFEFENSADSSHEFPDLDIPQTLARMVYAPVATSMLA